jgi:DNA-binding CsgD family transcriptional regulator
MSAPQGRYRRGQPAGYAPDAAVSRYAASLFPYVVRWKTIDDLRTLHAPNDACDESKRAERIGRHPQRPVRSRLKQPIAVPGPEAMTRAQSPPAGGPFHARYIGYLQDDVMDSKDELTYFERRILRLLARDLTLREIGSELHVSVKSVRTHVHSIYRKLRVSSRIEAVNAGIGPPSRT